MEFPLWYLLVFFAVFALITTAFAFFNLFHVSKYGLQSGKTTVVLAAYVIIYTTALVASFALLSQFDWSATADLSTLLPAGSTTRIL